MPFGGLAGVVVTVVFHGRGLLLCSEDSRELLKMSWKKIDLLSRPIIAEAAAGLHRHRVKMRPAADSEAEYRY